MQLDAIKHELTISEIASVYAQKMMNDLKSEESTLKHQYNEAQMECQLKLNSKIRELFEKSKYFQAFTLIFGDEEPQFYYHNEIKQLSDQQFDEISQYRVTEQFRELLKIEKMPIMYLNKVSNNGIYTLSIKVASSQISHHSYWLELDEKLDTDGIDYESLGKIGIRLNEISNELRKDWDKIYSTHFIAKKMADMGLTESISIPELPKIELNSSLS